LEVESALRLVDRALQCVLLGTFGIGLVFFQMNSTFGLAVMGAGFSPRGSRPRSSGAPSRARRAACRVDQHELDPGDLGEVAQVLGRHA
jgi:hypothetical protein